MGQPLKIPSAPPLTAPELVRQLRGVVESPTESNRPPSIPVVISPRSTGKTTGLVTFLGERILVNDGLATIAVIAANEDILREFSQTFKANFPKMKEPVYGTSSESLRGLILDEVYIEEVFLFKRSSLISLASCATVVVGVGTPEYPLTLTYPL